MIINLTKISARRILLLGVCKDNPGLNVMAYERLRALALLVLNLRTRRRTRRDEKSFSSLPWIQTFFLVPSAGKAVTIPTDSWSQRTCGLRRGSAAAGLLGLRVRIPPGAFMSLSLSLLWVLCVFRKRSLSQADRSSRGFYLMWHFWVWSWSLYNEEALAHAMRGKKFDWNITAPFWVSSLPDLGS